MVMTTKDSARDGDSALGRPWLALCLAIALHLGEEAHGGFLSNYREAVHAVRELLPIVASPSLVLAAGMWLAVAMVGILTALSPYAYRGKPWMRVATIGLSLIALANVTGYIGGSLLARSLIPGTFTLPLLVAAGVYALVVAWRWHPESARVCRPA
jgi:hypothetical protein